ncbi:hypothetical protein Scep_030039 [Stephania cephalantha]|uniref:Uncharacterized protein n=1 Tax=Stephania cephalantha TaxID=152367 RepID=A0AAP0E247_9MAGN
MSVRQRHRSDQRHGGAASSTERASNGADEESGMRRSDARADSASRVSSGRSRGGPAVSITVATTASTMVAMVLGDDDARSRG